MRWEENPGRVWLSGDQEEDLPSVSNVAVGSGRERKDRGCNTGEAIGDHDGSSFGEELCRSD